MFWSFPQMKYDAGDTSCLLADGKGKVIPITGLCDLEGG